MFHQEASVETIKLTLGYIVSLILFNLGHVFRFRINHHMMRVVYIFKHLIKVAI